MNMSSITRILLKLSILVIFNSSIVSAETWRSLGKLSNLEHASFGLIDESCQYRLKSFLPRINGYLPADGRGLPGVLYFDSVSRQQISVNFGQTILIRSVDYDIIAGLKNSAAFVNQKDGATAQKILKDNTNRVLGVRMVVTEGFSFFNPTSPTTASLSLELHYIAGKKGVRKYFNLLADSFELETDCAPPTP